MKCGPDRTGGKMKRGPMYRNLSRCPYSAVIILMTHSPLVVACNNQRNKSSHHPSIKPHTQLRRAGNKKGKKVMVTQVQGLINLEDLRYSDPAIMGRQVGKRFILNFKA